MKTEQLAIIMRLLSASATVAAIVEATGVRRQTIYTTLRHLERAQVARICRWNCDHTGRAVEPVWSLGSEPSDVRRRLTPAEKMTRHRRKKKRSDYVMKAIVATASTASKEADE